MAPVSAFKWTSASSWSSKKRSSVGGQKLVLLVNSVCAGVEDEVADVTGVSMALYTCSLHSWHGFCVLLHMPGFEALHHGVATA